MLHDIKPDHGTSSAEACLAMNGDSLVLLGLRKEFLDLGDIWATSIGVLDIDVSDAFVGESLGIVG